jgi:hypothetical protein
MMLYHKGTNTRNQLNRRLGSATISRNAVLSVQKIELPILRLLTS